MSERKQSTIKQSAQKLLSVVVPCFNSQAYMERALDSLPVQDGRLEILIVDDGSTDATREIADGFQARYPDVCIAIHQENGGHGSAIMAGFAKATGLYFDVLDSDDWVDTAQYLNMLDTLERTRDDPVDLLVRNTVYEKTASRRRFVLHFRGILPREKVFSWAESKPFPLGNSASANAAPVSLPWSWKTKGWISYLTPAGNR